MPTLLDMSESIFASTYRSGFLNLSSQNFFFEKNLTGKIKKKMFIFKIKDKPGFTFCVGIPGYGIN